MVIEPKEGQRRYVTHPFSPHYLEAGRIVWIRHGRTKLTLDSGEAYETYSAWLSPQKPREPKPPKPEPRPALDPKYGEEITLL